MEIIILMIIVSVIGNIIKSAGQQQQTGPAKKCSRPGKFPRQGAFRSERYSRSMGHTWTGQHSQPGWYPGKGLYEQSKQPSKVHKYLWKNQSSTTRKLTIEQSISLLRKKSNRRNNSSKSSVSQEALQWIGSRDSNSRYRAEKRHKLEFSKKVS